MELVQLFERVGADGQRLPAPFMPVLTSRRAPRVATHVARRERIVFAAKRRTPQGLIVDRVFRLLPIAPRTGRSGVFRRLALGGVIVDQQLPGCSKSHLDRILTSAGITSVDQLAIGSGDTLLAICQGAERRVVLRVGLLHQPGDPSHAFEGLHLLTSYRLVPDPIGAGRIGDWAWTCESAVDGRRSTRELAAVVPAVSEFLATLPRRREPPNLRRELEVVATHLPDTAPILARLGARLDATFADVASVMRHGDLWSGNLLVLGGDLVGVVDWDWWSPAGVPGTDLLHLMATDTRHRQGRSLGAVVRSRPWELPSVSGPLARLLAAQAVDPSPDLLASVGTAWWLTQISGDLHRNPTLAADTRWVQENVSSVLADFQPA